MEYKYCNNDNFEDYASGRVLYSAEGVPNFPVRLINEIFGYALEYSSKKQNLCVYDPCCGGGYSLTVLRYWQFPWIRSKVLNILRGSGRKSSQSGSENLKYICIIIIFHIKIEGGFSVRKSKYYVRN